MIVFELVLRALNPIGILPSATDDEPSYRAIVPQLLAFGAPDVAIVGSSRARRGVNAPSLRKAFTMRGEDVRVGNFALGAARSEETEVTVRRLLEARPKPRLVVWPVAPRDLDGGGTPPGPWVRYLWRLSDWWRSRTAVGAAADRYLPEALRSEASRHSWLMRYRPIVRDLIESSQRRPMRRMFSELLRGDRDITPIHGSVDPKHLTSAGTASKPVTADGVRRYLGSAFMAPDWPENDHQSRSLVGAIQALKDARIPVLLIEVPTHPLMEEQQPRKTTEKFRRFLKGVSKRNGVKFVSLPDLEIELGLTDFYEQSHLNYLGAEKYTDAIAKRVVKAFPRERR